MGLHSWFVRATAGDDQRLQVFRDFYFKASPDQRRRLYEYVKSVAELSPADLDGSVRFAGEIGAGSDRVLDVEVSCSFLPDGPTASMSPHRLRSAIEAWERGEEYTPDAFEWPAS